MLNHFFNPSSLAVIGASREPGKVGYEILRNVLTSGYRGEVYPINPNATEIQGIKCYRSVLDVPGQIDLGIVTLPANLVSRIASEAAEKGLRGLVIISAGFKEAGGDGAKLEREVVDICRKAGIRVLGPNCLGFIDTATPLNASFAPNMPRKGNIAFVSQSGALGTGILDWAVTERIGFSKFVSLGNKADLNECDILDALAGEEETKVILLYIEGITDGERFLKTAGSVTRKKPVIVLKSGVSAAGARAASSHTGAMAGSDLVFNVAFEHTGVIRVSTAQELFDLAEAFSTQPIPAGPNVAIVTNAGGPGILATDSCEKYNLRVASVKPETVEKLRSGLPPASGFFNPIDILGDAPPSRYKFAVETMLESQEVDSLLVILTPQAMTQPVETARVVIEVAARFKNKPVVASFIGGDSTREAVSI
ncbi:MAG: CoA-binding protein, partial [Candidatus Bathyarchaeia archaeon]